MTSSVKEKTKIFLEDIIPTIQTRLLTTVAFLFFTFGLSFLEKINLSIIVPALLLVWIIEQSTSFLIIKKQKTVSRMDNVFFGQFIFDLLMFTLIIHYIGGVEWIGGAFYLFSVIYFVFYISQKNRKIFLIFFTISLYTALVFLEYFGIIPHYGIVPSSGAYENFSYVFTTLTALGATFVFVAFTVNLFTGRLRQRDKKLSEINIQLTEEKNKISSIVANFKDPVIVLDKNNKLVIVNPAAANIFSFSDSELGTEIATSNQFSTNNFKKIIKNTLKVKKIKEESVGGYVVEEVSLNSGGREIVYKVITTKVIGINNEFFGTMKIFQDLTREKNLDRLKTEFISIAAHQLRTPLSAIKWVIKMVLEGDAGKINDEQKNLLNKGYVSNERVIKLVDGLLNVSRIEDGQFGYNFTKCNFQEILNMVVSDSERLIIKNHFDFKINKSNKIPSLYADEERIAMVMQNLLDNSIKYTPEYGKIEINIKNDSKNLIISIKDNGVGIPESDKVKLFSKFFRASNVIRLETEGNGLGLFITKNIIEKHGGKISVESKEGKGTIVKFFLPLKGNVDNF